ncbi:pentapeptide repeat-containing protein [Streptomyces sp. NBC_01003]|uniref:pentapeptide repeat-containing protein n=1 Tax=Streptomyces sp. NBC_01003 TaxID=2903714 RepID=UPI0038704396|nr:pentapeptide repeat-containing protein [Streptomyces sp. NBC_01003]
MKTPHPLRWGRGVRARRRAARNTLPLEQRRTRVRQKVRARRWGTIVLIAVGTLALLAGLPWLVWRGPYVLDEKYLDPSELEKGSAALVTGLRTATVACVAALGAGIALLYTARTYRLTRRGQITERFTKALERLGSTERYVRIGGILALEQIVQDAPEQAATDAARVLGHFIRDRAPKAALTTPTPGPDGRTPTSTAPDSEQLPQEPAADVQAALTALTRAESRTHVDPRELLDLHGLHLAGAQLHRADLTEAYLRGATLTEADLGGAMLTNADLLGATLTKADLGGAMLTGADLGGAMLTGADLYRAMLTKADLGGATLTKANLGWATLTGANLSGATLTGAYLSRATLTGADLGGAMLTGANLSGAMLTKADLGRATLTGADLRGVDLSDVLGLTHPLTEVKTDEETILPPKREKSADSEH